VFLVLVIPARAAGLRHTVVLSVGHPVRRRLNMSEVRHVLRVLRGAPKVDVGILLADLLS
jgi:hypothetical protein